MTSRISHTTFNARNAYAQSLFWSQVLGWTEVPDDPNEPGHQECMIIEPGGGGRLLFIAVPDAKQLRNRVHLDLRPVDGTREQEVQRLMGLGATLVDDRRVAGGAGWIVLADPEGNEFCILRSDAELQGQGSTTPA